MAKLVTNANLQPRSSPGTYTTEALTEVIVTDVIMNDRHEYWSRLGGWDALGTIFFKSVTQRNIGYDLSTPNKYLARPFFSNQKYYPLLGERVVIFSAITKDVLANGDGDKTTRYYLPNLNIWNHPHHNALPIVENYNNNKSNYNNTLDGSVKKSQNNALDIPLGETFVEKDFIKPLRPFEGDNILEGRFGNTIRLGRTSRPLNPWSQNGENSDPIIIIRNGQYNDINDTTFIPNTEDINNDDSSIYLTSNQNISNFEVASKNLQSYNKGELPYVSPEDRLNNPPPL